MASSSALVVQGVPAGKATPVDSHKIAVLLRGGLLPQAYVFPAAMRSTRDLRGARPTLRFSGGA
jgi:hypothetical protein